MKKLIKGIILIAIISGLMGLGYFLYDIYFIAGSEPVSERPMNHEDNQDIEEDTVFDHSHMDLDDYMPLMGLKMSFEIRGQKTYYGLVPLSPKSDELTLAFSLGDAIVYTYMSLTDEATFADELMNLDILHILDFNGDMYDLNTYTELMGTEAGVFYHVLNQVKKEILMASVDPVFFRSLVNESNLSYANIFTKIYFEDQVLYYDQALSYDDYSEKVLALIHPDLVVYFTASNQSIAGDLNTIKDLEANFIYTRQGDQRAYSDLTGEDLMRVDQLTKALKGDLMKKALSDLGLSKNWRSTYKTLYYGQVKNKDHEGWDYIYAFEDEVYYIENQEEWIYGKHLEISELSGYRMGPDGLSRLEELDASQMKERLDYINDVNKELTYNEMFFLGGLSSGLVMTHPELKTIETWEQYLDIILNEDWTDLARGFERSGMTFVKDPKARADHFNISFLTPDGIYLFEYGRSYYNIYKIVNDHVSFKKLLNQEEDNLIHEVRNWMPVSSGRIDKPILAYHEAIEDLAKTLIDKEMTSNEIVDRVGTYVIDQITYADDSRDYSNHTSAKALDQGVGVCESYTFLSQSLLSEAGIESYYLIADNPSQGEDGLTHAYNLVYIEGQYRFYDFTWADKATWIDKTYYDFNLDDHTYKPFLSLGVYKYMTQGDH